MKCIESNHPANYIVSQFLCHLVIHFAVSHNSISGKQRPRSDCIDAKADQGFRFKNSYSHDTAHIFTFRNNRACFEYLWNSLADE